MYGYNTFVYNNAQFNWQLTQEIEERLILVGYLFHLIDKCFLCIVII